MKSYVIVVSSIIFLLSSFSVQRDFTFFGQVNPLLDQQAKKPQVKTIPKNYLSSIPTDQKKDVTNYEELLELWEDLDYTHETWQAGVREVPRVYIIEIGDKWGAETSKQITTLNKKRVFFRAIVPLVLRANEWIAEDRSQLIAIYKSFKSNNTISSEDKNFLDEMSKTYKIENSKNEINQNLFDHLLNRVDIIPPSLALAQAAVESGWGTSRFTHIGNSIFGQWSWGEDAIKPEEQREHLGNYGIASFESLQSSVCGYILNINTHNAYKELRNIRTSERKKNIDLSGVKLAEGLIHYSERGQIYIDEIKSMISYNHLEATDKAYLGNQAPMFLIPN